MSNKRKAHVKRDTKQNQYQNGKIMKKQGRKRQELTETQKILLSERSHMDCTKIARKLGITRQQVNNVFLGMCQNLKVWWELSKLVEKRVSERQGLNQTANEVLAENLVEQFMQKASGVLTPEELKKRVEDMRKQHQDLCENIRKQAETYLQQLELVREQAEADWREAQNREAV